MNELTKEEKIKKILEKVSKQDITAYKVSKDTGLNESGVNRIFDGSTKNPHNGTVDILYQYLYGKNEIEYSTNTTKNLLEESLEDYLSEVSHLKTNDPKQLLRIYLEYVANKDSLSRFKRFVEEKEIEFLQRYIEIKDEYGSIENYLNEKV